MCFVLTFTNYDEFIFLCTSAKNNYQIIDEIAVLACCLGNIGNIDQELSPSHSKQKYGESD